MNEEQREHFKEPCAVWIDHLNQIISFHPADGFEQLPFATHEAQMHFALEKCKDGGICMKRTIRVFSLLLADVMLLSAQALATEPAQKFTDVTKQDYFYDAVNWAVEKEITSGVSKDAFAPERDCTRADFVTFLWRAAGKPVVNYAMNFSDVKESSYYAEAVRWAASLGIVTGLSKNTFGAANAVTREQAVTMLWRFAKQQGFDTTQGGMAIREYNDYDSLSEYAREAMAWAVNTEILKGSNNRLLPDAACTRAQIVTFLWRAAGSPAPKSTAMPFTDVAADSYYERAVLWAVENGITKGTSDTTFSPNATCSRAQIVTFLWRSQKSPAAGSVNPFPDVSADAYYADAVLWAVKESVTSGTTATTFSPNADCTRAQIVTFIYRALAE